MPFRTLAFAALLACLPTRAPAQAAAPGDSTLPSRLDVQEVFAQSILAPAWGSYRSESYLVGTLQTLADLMAVAAMVGLAVDPPDPDAGAHLAFVFPAALFVGNRLLGAPLNAVLASDYRGSPGARRDMRLPSARPHGRVSAAAGAYAGSGEVTVGAEWRRAGFKLALGLGEGPGADYGWFDAEGVRHDEHHYVEGFFGVDAYYRLPVNAFMDVEPGLRCQFERHRYGGQVDDAQIPGRRTGYSPSLIPHASLVLHPYRRVELAIGAGRVLGKPSHLEAFEERAAARSPLGARDKATPWRLNVEAAVPIF